MTAPRDLDLVLLGATGYTGRLVAAELALRAGAEGVTWGLAGRDRPRLEALRAELGLPALPLTACDVHDAAQVDALAARARAIVTTVGPYARHGSAVVEACARHGTAYADLAGEVAWMRRMIDAHHDEARASGARIVHACGFDSVPSDLGVLLVHEALQARGLELARASATFRVRGGASGGTVATMLDITAEAVASADARRVLASRDGLVPGAPPRPRAARRDVTVLGVGHGARGFTTPFLMALINTRVVARSGALTGRYPGLPYDEVMAVGEGPRGLATALGVRLGIGLFAAAAAVGPLRRVIAARVPQPGEGPSAETRARGRFTAEIVGEAATGERVVATIADAFDPGYGSTSRMIAQAALALARGEGTPGGGVLTPASALGDALVRRLRAIAFTIDVA